MDVSRPRGRELTVIEDRSHSTVAEARRELVLSPALSKACPEPRRRVEGLSKGPTERCWPDGLACRSRRCWIEAESLPCEVVNYAWV